MRNITLDTITKADGIFVTFRSTAGIDCAVAKITYCIDDGSWSVRPANSMFAEMFRVLGSLQAAEYYALVIAYEMESMACLPA